MRACQRLVADPVRAPPLRAQEMMIDGRAPEAGELFKNPNLAATFRALGKGGKTAFYTGGYPPSALALGWR